MDFSDKEKIESFCLLQTIMIDKQNANKPFFIGRLSGNETFLSGIVLNNLNIPQYIFYQMLFGAGIQLKTKEDLFTYVNKYTIATSHTDLLGVWDGGMHQQAELFYKYIDKTYPTIKKICAQALEPYYFLDHPDYNFDSIFNNKKILIITSHKETTSNQLANINHIFNKPIFHKTSSFYIYKPPQQNAGSHDNNSWEVHYEKMQNEINEIKKEYDFDIALVSCGGFGMIISDYIYTELKSSVIYAGGSLQLYFGIIGKRWSQSPKINKLMNKYWTNVLDCDKPVNVKLCENGCYW